MPSNVPHVLELFDAAGTARGLLVSPELWASVKTQLLPVLQKAAQALDPAACPQPEERPEPLADWETLLAAWDFGYPPAYDVSCQHCGSTTENWTQDTPRKFRLRAANLGGLVTFQCQSCRSLVLKKHFKKHVAVECQPFVARD